MSTLKKEKIPPLMFLVKLGVSSKGCFFDNPDIVSKLKDQLTPPDDY